MVDVSTSTSAITSSIPEIITLVDDVALKLEKEGKNFSYGEQRHPIPSSMNERITMNQALANDAVITDTCKLLVPESSEKSEERSRQFFEHTFGPPRDDYIDKEGDFYERFYHPQSSDSDRYVFIF